MKIIYLASLLLLTGCATVDVDQNRAGCNYNDGKGSARYGTLTQYAKGVGDVKAAHVYVGDSLIGKVEITCNAEMQEVKVD